MIRAALAVLSLLGLRTSAAEPVWPTATLPIVHPRLLRCAAFHELLGLQPEYVTRAPDATGVVTVHASEQHIARRVPALVAACDAAEGRPLGWQITTNGTGDIELRSAAVAQSINSLYVETGTNQDWNPLTLAPAAVEFAERPALLGYLRGAYERFGRPGLPVIGMANAPYKIRTIAQALRKVGCTDVRLYAARDALPSSYAVVFEAPPDVREQMGAPPDWGDPFASSNTLLRRVDSLP